MKHAKLAMTLLFLFLGMNILQAQNYNMTNGGSISTCSGTFYDSGGSGGDYGSNETLVYTICPSTPGQAIQVNFTSFDLENSYDNLSIYDGNSTGASLLGTYSGTTIPGAITATTSNPSGCLTFRFTSDGSVAYSGWAASISCVPPVPPSLDILMQNGSTTTCSGTFYDSGGNGSNYGSSENNTFTICPDNGGMTNVDFTSFELENGWDFLTIYDGNSTSAPTLGSYTGTAGPGFVAATTSNTSGCLTFVFSSDPSSNYAGWSANIACTQPCQDIIANAIFSPAPDGDGIIRICQGTAVTMNGTGVYPDNNTSYSQSDATSTFTWSTQDGPAIVGQSVTHTYTTEGAYIVQLEIEDVQGCSNANNIDQEIRVSTTPNFSGTIGSPDPICLGEQASFNGVATPVTYEVVCNQPAFPPISLPDGSGVSYETLVNLDCYSASQTLTSINDLLSICINMEHSYMGDLDIVIECPSGQTVSLHDYSGGGNTFLGIPVDDDSQPLAQGTGYDYCWSPTASNGDWAANSGGTLAAGTYESSNPMSGLVGCDLNGDWTLIITDHLGSDNGFIFDWSLNFNPAILPPAITFTPTIVTEGWQADPTIVGGTNPITVEPTSTGNACYTFEVTDNFGCDYDTTVCITVDPSPVIDPVADVTQCNPFTLPAITGVDLTGNEAYYTGMNGTGTQYNPGDVISATTTLYIYDRATVAPFCENETSFTITIINAVLTMNCPPALTAVCDISEQPAYANFAAFQAAGGSASTTGGASVLPATFTLLSEVSDGNTCPEVITRTYQIEDDCGNTETCTQTITINDLIAPTGTAPADLTVQCIGDVPAADVTLITDEADNCTVNPTVTHVSDVSDGNTCPEVITRTYNIADDCGNNIDVVQTITINDVINPTGTAPADLAVQCIGDVPAADVTLITDEADNCTVNPIVTHVSDVSDGNTCPEVITRTYNIADDCGNNIDVVQTITIDDNTNPTASNPAPVTVECLTDVPPVAVTVVTDAADNCTVNPTVAFVSESSDNNTCNGEVITRIYSVTDDCGNSINVTHTITVDSYTPTFTVSSTDPTACGASDGTITISGLNANTDYIFSYDGGADANITTDAAGEYIVTGLTAGSYIDYTVSDVDCPSCNTTENVTMTLTDPNAPTIDAGVDQEVCEGETVTLTAVNPDGATITWDNGVTDGVGFVSPVGTTNYTVTAEIANCFSSDVVSVLVHPTPTVSAGNDVEVCDGTQVTLQGSGAATYVWDNGVTDGTPFTLSVGTITYSVVGTSAFGCEASDQVDVTVNENPEVLFEADVTEGCTPLEVNLVSLTPGAADCQFTIEGMQIDGCDINYTFTNPGCYDVNLEVESVNGCVSDLTLNNYICIDNYPIADFTVEPGQLSNMNDEATFVNGSIGAETYDWSFGDGETSTENNPIHTYSVEEDGEDAYEIQLIAYSELGCPDTAYVKLPFIEDLIYYVPNTFTPDGNKYNETFKPVFSSGFDPQDYNLKIFNRWGELIFESQNAAYGWDGTYGVDNNTIVKEGVYVWKIEFKKKYNDERIELVGHVNLLK